MQSDVFISSEMWFSGWFLESPDKSVQTFVPSQLGKVIQYISEIGVPTEQRVIVRLMVGRGSIHFNMGCEPWVRRGAGIFTFPKFYLCYWRKFQTVSRKICKQIWPGIEHRTL
jgi:hypothetical protein